MPTTVSAQSPIAATTAPTIPAPTVATSAPSSVASLATAPVVKVTPIATPVSKAGLTSIALHAAATRPGATTVATTAPGTIVRTPQTVLATATWAQQLNG